VNFESPVSRPPIRRPMQQRAPVSEAYNRPPAQSPVGSPPPQRGKRWLVLVIIAVLLAGAAFGWFHFASKKTPAGGKHGGTSTAANPDTISLLATGDFIAHDSVNTAALSKDGTYHYLPMLTDFPPIFAKFDVRFCNDPILNGGAVSTIDGYPKFNSPPEFVTDMGKLGCNVVNTASNHSFDKTQNEITASVEAWSGVPNMLAVAGENRSQAEHDTVHYFTVKGVKFAFLAYTAYINNESPAQNDYGVNVFSKDFTGQQIVQAKQNGAQIIIVSMRWGAEYANAVNTEQKADAQWLADQGVALVLGHGPHVLQPAQQLTGSSGNKTLVWYSLGNFINSQEPPETLFNGLAFMDFDVKTKQIKNVRYLPIYMFYDWTAAEAKADDISARTNLHLMLLEDTTQQMIDRQQLKTSVSAQKERIQNTLNANGLNIPLITSKQL
jgi:poly-gamma-glutamate capsule biosynthesis protein CapA/YwtB (metallophosphatase superfamily)